MVLNDTCFAFLHNALIITLIFFLAITTATFAEEISPENTATNTHQSIFLRLKEVRANCQAKAQDFWDTGNTVKMMQGSDIYLNCFHDQVLMASESYFLDKGDKEEFVRILNAYKNITLDLYKILHQGPCDPCGTHTHPFHIMDTAYAFQNILQEMLENSDEHNSPSKIHND